MFILCSIIGSVLGQERIADGDESHCQPMTMGT
jgi:hypothetical protein